ncbi:MAG: hypothetical protein REI78_03490 [Pedobacter sp.]|nr:hypothetical protein [Pedobacter sp.]
MKSLIFKSCCIFCALLLTVSSAFANVRPSDPPSKTSYRKRDNYGFTLYNYTGVNFNSVTISGYDSTNTLQSVTLYNIAHLNSEYWDFWNVGPLHSIAVTISMASSVVYAFDVHNSAWSRIYDTINYSGTPRTFYIPDNENNELTIECYTEDW